MSDLYETDILAWSEEQARRLLRVAANDRRNDESPDWANIVEEIESVGRSQLSAVRSLLIQALAHDLKAEAWPLSQGVSGWRAEARRSVLGRPKPSRPLCGSGSTSRIFMPRHDEFCPIR